MGTLAHYFNCSNPNGSIPNMFKSKAQWTAADVVKALKKYLDKRDGRA